MSPLICYDSPIVHRFIPCQSCKKNYPVVCCAYLVHVSSDLSGCRCQSAEVGFGRNMCSRETLATQQWGCLILCPHTPNQAKGLFRISEGAEEVHECGAVLSVKNTLQNEHFPNLLFLSSPFGREGKHWSQHWWGLTHRRAVSCTVCWLSCQHLKIRKFHFEIWIFFP